MGFALCFIMTTSYHPNLPINLWMCILPYYYYTSNIRHQHVDDFYGFVRICIIRRSNDATDVGSSAAEFACTTYHWRPTSCSTLLLFGSFVCTVFTYLGHLADVFYWARWWECSRKILASLRGQGGGYYQEMKNAQWDYLKVLYVLNCKATFTALAYLGHLFVRYLRIWVIWLTYFIGQDDESAVEKF